VDETLEKIDLKKELKALYNPSTKQVTAVEVPKMNFLMVDGSGDPNVSQEYKDAVEALFSLSYTIKFMIKKTKGVDYAVMPLEGLWWVDDMSKFNVTSKDEWKWTAMIMQPEDVTEYIVVKQIEVLNKKKNLPSLSKIRFEGFHEGLSAQIMYIGAYADEGPTIKMIHEFINNNHGALEGKHHEIYLSDPRRAAKEKLKTIIRQPMKKK
jgi:hypothetical protein